MSESKEIVGETVLEEVIDIGKGRSLVFTAKPSVLKRDFALEAERQGADNTDIDGILKKLNFNSHFSGRFNEYNKYSGLLEQKNGNLWVTINIPKIYKIIKTDKEFDSDEKTLAVFRQTVLRIWRHERQHVIQEIIPVEKDDDSEKERWKKLGKGLSLGMNVLKFTAVSAVADFILEPNKGNGISNTFLLLCAGMAIGGEIASQTRYKYEYLASPVEVEARKAESFDSPKEPPFSIRIEKRT